MKRVSILGATGSIGQNTLDLVQRDRSAFQVVALTGAGLGRVTLGVVAGLVLGKPLGVLGASWLAVRSGLAHLPEGVNWPCVPNKMSARVPTASRTAATIAAERSMSARSGWCGSWIV